MSCAAQVSPMSVEQWLLMARVPVPQYPRGGQTWHSVEPEPSEDQLILMELEMLNGSGYRIGALRKNGTVGGVRRESRAKGGRKSELMMRLCKKCGDVMPGFCFYKHGNGRRETCKWCDVAARSERRRQQKSRERAVTA
jgi:hypothetical protein